LAEQRKSDLSECLESLQWKQFRKKRGENKMKPSTKDKIKGKMHELKGNVKKKAGQVTDNPKLAAEGRDERFAGKVQKKVGQIKKLFGK
jgi:uncharacterized protein YjbJ (UPF0337 family)